MRARPDQQLQILVLQDLPDTLNRHSGLLPSSFAYSFRLGPGNAKPEITGSIPPGPSINASCGTIIVARKTQPRNLTVSVSRDDPLVLGIHRCRTAKAPVAVVALLAVVDNARLVGVAPPWGGYDRITAENSYLPIPPSFTADADALQVFVVNAENVTGGDPLALEPSSNAALIDTKPS